MELKENHDFDMLGKNANVHEGAESVKESAINAETVVDETVKKQIAEFIPLIDKSIESLKNNIGGIPLTMLAITLTLKFGDTLLAGAGGIDNFDSVKAEYMENPVATEYMALLKGVIVKFEKFKADMLTKLGSM